MSDKETAPEVQKLCGLLIGTIRVGTSAAMPLYCGEPHDHEGDHVPAAAPSTRPTRTFHRAPEQPAKTREARETAARVRLAKSPA